MWNKRLSHLEALTSFATALIVVAVAVFHDAFERDDWDWPLRLGNGALALSVPPLAAFVVFTTLVKTEYWNAAEGGPNYPSLLFTSGGVTAFVGVVFIVYHFSMYLAVAFVVSAALSLYALGMGIRGADEGRDEAD